MRLSRNLDLSRLDNVELVYSMVLRLGVEIWYYRDLKSQADGEAKGEMRVCSMQDECSMTMSTLSPDPEVDLIWRTKLVVERSKFRD